ncbi:MAG: nitroreductase family protein [Candidatus Acidiferrales bacterium]
MEKRAETKYPIVELLQNRWSPRAFSERPIEPEKLRSILEAARWAPSSFNDQPWYFLVAMREDREQFEKMLSCLVEGNAAWAKNAPVLMLGCARLVFEKSGKPNRHALYDLGQAIAHLTVQASSLGIYLHQMAGIYPDKAREAYGVPEGFEAVTGISMGYQGDPSRLPDELREREVGPHSPRKPFESFVFSGHWGEKSPLFKGES